METAIMSLICISLILFGGMTISQDFISTTDSTTAGFEEMNESAVEIKKTDVSIITAYEQGQSTLLVVVENDGQTKIADFDMWDVIAEYHKSGSGNLETVYDNYVESGPAGGEWTIEGIYSDWDPNGDEDPDDGIAEVFEPGTLNPGEQMIMQVKVLNPLQNSNTHRVTVSTPNGINTQFTFDTYK